MRFGINVGIMADILQCPSYFCVARQSWGCTQSLDQNKLCQGHKRLFPVSIAFTVTWMKALQPQGHKQMQTFVYCLACKPP